jgi:hypothetical protein
VNIVSTLSVTFGIVLSPSVGVTITWIQNHCGRERSGCYEIIDGGSGVGVAELIREADHAMSRNLSTRAKLDFLFGSEAHQGLLIPKTLWGFLP